MSRTKQRLINYHSSGPLSSKAPAISDVSLGEIVVIHNVAEPLLGIKVSGTTEGSEKFAWFISSAAVVSAIDSISTGAISNLERDLKLVSGYVMTVSGGLETLSGQVVDNYATSAQTYNAISAVNSDINKLSGTVFDDYITSASVTSALESLSTSIETIEGDIDDLSGSTYTIEGSLSELSGGVETLSGDVVTAINNAISNVYKVKGTVETVAALQNISNPSEGDVYNVSSASGTPGTGDYIPAGTNFVWVSDGENQGHWDALGGTINLDAYATTTDLEAVETKVNNLGTAFSGFSGHVLTNYATSADTYNAINGATGNISELSGSVYTFIETTVPETYATSSDTHSAISEVATSLSTLDSSVSTLSGSVVDIEAAYITKESAEAQIGNVSGAVSSLTNSFTEFTGTTAPNTYLTIASATTKFGEIDGSITSLEGVDTAQGSAISGISGVVLTAIQDVDFGKIADEATGVTQDTITSAKSYTNTTTNQVTLDLTELVIDCGDF